ncbi:MAG: hypothetical protein A2748_01470 [Candidatus Wildermuthbacteria bacterium RIFCSPHIGHO2_01_FULL_45_20]|uniref:Type II secretion system protein J n=1 Tax=Candidatus Wildermuthbacteria bacterium RIFCSPHIGHO2_02_FULL_45_25 TaxID=1802450 RepID=A0A1G2R3A9_9BACT|nr:MAG: hypothetical protein A2748_01470 [Candidatus Wildermuthbacteria bacterium RIFCSPHIGHO2_01_FULL_45_20]OHA66879.1 MAG: hypothetical protein A3C04_02455 [Candidatus Wildermuthbacteria bacterium RIFCSPHIGHO2_02_FULL_45_25]
MKLRAYQQGFTLVEMLVATSIFVGVITMASALLLSSIQSQQHVIAQQELYDGVSYVAEYMSRAIRMAQKAKDSSCISDKWQAVIDEGTPGGSLLFINSKGECQQFKREVDAQGIGFISETIGSGGVSVRLTAKNIDVKAFRTTSFLESEQPAVEEFPSGKRQARLTFTIEAAARKGNPATQPSIIVQTTLSPRQVNPGN